MTTRHCKWCARQVEPRNSFGEQYWRHVDDLTAQCIIGGKWHETEAAPVGVWHETGPND